MSTLVCHTGGCDNQDVPVDMDLVTQDPWTGQPSYVDQVTCGGCGQPITDIAPPITPGAPA